MTSNAINFVLSDFCTAAKRTIDCTRYEEWGIRFSKHRFGKNYLLQNIIPDLQEEELKRVCKTVACRCDILTTLQDNPYLTGYTLEVQCTLKDSAAKVFNSLRYRECRLKVLPIKAAI